MGPLGRFHRCRFAAIPEPGIGDADADAVDAGWHAAQNANPSLRWGSSAAKLNAASAMLRVSMPGVSSVKLSGTSPRVDQRPLVSFNRHCR